MIGRWRICPRCCCCCCCGGGAAIGGDPGVTVDTDELATCPMGCVVICTLAPVFADDAGCPEDDSSNEDDVGWLAYDAGETESCERGSPNMGPPSLEGVSEFVGGVCGPNDAKGEWGDIECAWGVDAGTGTGACVE